jgi:hypothetical protein
MDEVHRSPGTEPQQVASEPQPIRSADDLIAALSGATAGDTIHLLGQEYQVGVPLLIRNGVTLRGVGVMQVVDGLPVGFQGTTTKITAKANLEGNLLTLGNGSKVEKLVLQNASQAHEDGEGRGGNLVAVGSRGRTDIVLATIQECELINKIKSDVGTDGPVGGAVLVYTRNPQKPAPPDPAPHENADVILALTRSIIRTPKDGKALVAMNFASRGEVIVNLTHNDIGGPLDVIGGLSRPDAVGHATTTIHSNRNRYSVQGASDVAAWQITGGSSSPFGGNANTDSNSAIVDSNDDQIVNFLVGISAVGGRRLPDGGTCSHNRAELTLTRMELATKPSGTDFMFVGAQSGGLLPAGDGNTVKVDVRQTTGSGPRENLYANSMGGGTGNRLDFVGTLADFNNSNHNIDPAPTAEFF